MEDIFDICGTDLNPNNYDEIIKFINSYPSFCFFIIKFLYKGEILPLKIEYYIIINLDVKSIYQYYIKTFNFIRNSSLLEILKRYGLTDDFISYVDIFNISLNKEIVDVIISSKKFNIEKLLNFLSYRKYRLEPYNQRFCLDFTNYDNYIHLIEYCKNLDIILNKPIINRIVKKAKNKNDIFKYYSFYYSRDFFTFQKKYLNSYSLQAINDILYYYEFNNIELDIKLFNSFRKKEIIVFILNFYIMKNIRIPYNIMRFCILRYPPCIDIMFRNYYNKDLLNLKRLTISSLNINLCNSFYFSYYDDDIISQIHSFKNYRYIHFDFLSYSHIDNKNAFLYKCEKLGISTISFENFLYRSYKI